MAANQDEIKTLQARNKAMAKSSDSLRAHAQRSRDDFCSEMDDAGRLDPLLESALETSGCQDFYRDSDIGERSAPQKSGAMIDRYLKDNLNHAANDEHHKSDRQEIEGHSLDAMVEAHAQPGGDPAKASMERELFGYRQQTTEHRMGAKDADGVPIEKPELSAQWKERIADHVTRGIAKDDPKIIEGLGGARGAASHLVERNKAHKQIATNSLDIGHNREKMAHLAELSEESSLDAYASKDTEASAPELSPSLKRADESRTASTQLSAEQERSPKLASTIGVFGEDEQRREVQALEKPEQQAPAGAERGRRSLEGRSRVTQEQADAMGQEKGFCISPERDKELRASPGGALYARGVDMVRDLRVSAAKQEPHVKAAKTEEMKGAAGEFRSMIEKLGIGSKLEQQRQRKAGAELGS